MAEAVMVRKSFLKKLIERGKEAAPVIIERTRSAARTTAHLARRGASATGRELVSDANGIFSAGLGALAAYVMSMDSIKKSEFLKKNWYVAPLVMVAIGYLLVRKKKPYGRTLMTIGGLLLVQAYQNRPKTDEKTDKPKGDTTETKGFEPAQFAAPYGARWVVTADGRQVLVPVRQLEHYERPGLPERRDMADAVARTADEIYGRTF